MIGYQPYVEVDGFKSYSINWNSSTTGTSCSVSNDYEVYTTHVANKYKTYVTNNLLKNCMLSGDWVDTTSSSSCWKTTTTGYKTCNFHHGNTYGNWSVKIYVAKTAQERLREMIRTRCAPAIQIACKHLRHTDDIREVRARETLHRVVGSEQYRNFLKRGFVTARNPKSGRVYQIFPGHGITQVYEKGIMIERLCVVLKGDFPPTDSTIIRYLMALNNEDQLWQLSVKHGARSRNLITPLVKPALTLPELYAGFKAA